MQMIHLTFLDLEVPLLCRRDELTGRRRPLVFGLIFLQAHSIKKLDLIFNIVLVFAKIGYWLSASAASGWCCGLFTWALHKHTKCCTLYWTLSLVIHFLGSWLLQFVLYASFSVITHSLPPPHIIAPRCFKQCRSNANAKPIWRDYNCINSTSQRGHLHSQSQQQWQDVERSARRVSITSANFGWSKQHCIDGRSFRFTSSFSTSLRASTSRCRSWALPSNCQRHSHRQLFIWCIWSAGKGFGSFERNYVSLIITSQTCSSSRATPQIFYNFGYSFLFRCSFENAKLYIYL